jgi:hypothetical protein
MKLGCHIKINLFSMFSKYKKLDRCWIFIFNVLYLLDKIENNW